MKNNLNQNYAPHKYGKFLLLLPLILILFFVINKWTADKTDIPDDPLAIQVKELLPNLAKIQKTPELNMVYIQGGSFTMGCTSEQGDDCRDNMKPAHQVTVQSFNIGKYEITNEDFVPFMNAKGNLKVGGVPWVNLEGRYRKVSCGIMKTNGEFVVKPGHEKLPMIYVSWYGAQAYAVWLKSKTGKNYRLPSESEWEYAARGGRETKEYKYAGSNKLTEVAWYKDNSDGLTHEAGTTGKGNELGLYDMSGNVWEWTGDYYTDNYNEIPEVKIDERWTYRVLRGGGWYNGPKHCQTANRLNVWPNDRKDFMGFRLVYSQ